MKKRESIITSVVAISRKQGIDALSIRDISDNSKVAVGTVYHYFSDKEDLLSQTMDYVLSKRKIALGKNDSKKDSTEERLDRFWTNLFNYYVNYPDELYFISHYSLLSDLPSSEHNLKPLLKIIERGIAQ